ncbi:MAG: 23S rRNA (uracil(1939)-C(5))-methyltransferase RlmD [Lachnospiraceae bacterium]|nr:23S rRNA (uracil(1939)-C(5))-methyltransferase RlmD [Lachnospiraceae bacterium]
MKKGQELTGRVTEVNFPNKGIVETEEGPIIVKNVIPGQKIKARVLKLRKGKPEGMLLEVLEPAPEAVSAQCPHFGTCGGCTYLTMSYEDQLKMKEKQALKLLESVVKYDFKWEGIKGSPVFEGYRNKMEFSFGDEYKDGPLSLGLHRLGSMFDVLFTKDCYICDEDYRAILVAVREYFLKKGFKNYHRMNHTGFLRHLLIRKSVTTGEILVALVTTDEEELDSKEFVELVTGLKLKGKIAGILHTINNSLSDVVQSDETRLLYGRDYIEESLLGLKFKIGEFSFFQTNSRSAEVLYSTVRDYVKSIDDASFAGSTVFDLYSGTGTITQLMSPVAAKVIGVEIVEEAVEAARVSAKENGIENCEFICGDVLKVLDDVTEKPGLIILDPPRDGIHPKALPKIIDYGVDNIIYISCKPTSLVRDLGPLQEAGYRVVRACAVDQFPWTANIEVCCLLEQKFFEAESFCSDRNRC